MHNEGQKMVKKLHQSIINHDLAGVHAYFVENNFLTINEADEKSHLTPLQLAAREGLTEVVLKLLLAGASLAIANSNAYSSPRRYAVNNGHTLTAQILFACDSLYSPEEKESDSRPLTDLAVIESVLCYLLTQKDISSRGNYQTVFKNVLSHLTPYADKAAIMGGLIELAVQQDKIDLLPLLCREGVVRQDLMCFTAGYWAIVEEKESSLDLICATDHDKTITLRQLYETRPKSLFNCYYKKWGESVQKRFIESKQKDAFTMGDASSEKINLAYQAAASANAETLSVLELTLEESVGVMQYAHSHHNYIALETFRKTIQPDVLFNVVSSNHLGMLALYLFIQNKQNSVIRFLSQINDEKYLLALLAMLRATPQGILYSLTSQAIQPNTQPTASIKKLMDFAKQALSATHAERLPLYLPILVRCIHDRYDIQLNGARLNDQGKISFANTLDEAKLNIVSRVSVRVGMDITSKPEPQDPLSRLPSDLTQQLYRYFNPVDQRSLSVASTRFRDEFILFKRGKKPGAQWIRNNTLQQLKAEIDALNTFIQKTNAVLSSQSFLRGRDLSFYIFLTLVCISAGLNAVLGVYAPRYNALRDDLDHTQITTPAGKHATCAEVSNRVGASICDDRNSYDHNPILDYVVCRDICDSLTNALVPLILAGVFSGASDIALISVFSWMIKDLSKNKDRFNACALSDFPSITTAFDELKAVFRYKRDNPFANSTHYNIGTVLAKARELLAAKQHTYEELNKEKLAEEKSVVTAASPSEQHAIDITDEEEKRSTVSSGQRLSLQVEGLDEMKTPLLGR